ncbi:MAG: DNA repair protein [Spirochaetales bacterium]|nr:DNA repair protein [Spirochaetales bacterium]
MVVQAGNSTHRNKIYKILLKHYGPQGWWPYHAGSGLNGHDGSGYHPGSYREPAWPGKFEICLGAVLTQNTSWSNVRKALASLREAGISGPADVLAAPQEELAQTIRASGYYNQKAKKLDILCRFIQDNEIEKTGKPPSRADLLALWGIGPETADSILLYAYNVPVFVIDAYTRRIFSRLGLISPDATYDDIQRFFTGRGIRDYTWANEYHALIVRHATEHCRQKPDCSGCPLGLFCLYKTDRKDNS